MKKAIHDILAHTSSVTPVLFPKLVRCIAALLMGFMVFTMSPFSNAQQTATVHAPVCVEFDHSHANFTAILKKVVEGKKVNYRVLKKDADFLSRYLHDLSAVCKSDFSRFSSSQKLAFFINAYNAYTLKLIVTHYPIKSIQQISSGAGDAWHQPIVALNNLFGQNITLDYLENKVIRPRFKEPRIHFALNCASRGCPPLRAAAYTPKGLYQQLNDVTRAFMANRSENQYEAQKNVLRLSKLFKWYATDFGGEDQLAAFFIQYGPSEQAKVVQNAIESGTPPHLEFNAYDWDLNQ
ncbi:MAG: DUF547 domain-containing protein [Deltaproteobacteria bacterium]|nr:DUF547 domain-containing protein [Deltaproteobacteria bacterium]